MNKKQAHLFGIIVLLCLIIVSCGIPDSITPLNEIKVTEISDTIFSIVSSDIKVDGNTYSNYGVDIYYKIYKKSSGTIKFDEDYQKVIASKSNYQTLLSQNGFLHIADREKTDNDNKASPVYQLPADWTITIDFSIGYKKVISIFKDSIISGSGKTFHRFTSSYKPFSPDQLITSDDSDLVAFRGDSTFNANDACFGIIIFTFAQDFETGYIPQYSTPKPLGPFDIK